MLKQSFIDRLAALAKVSAAHLAEAMKGDEEKDPVDDKKKVVVIDEKLQVFNETEIQARDRNQYDTGKKAGEEMLVKALGTKHIPDFKGNDAEKLVEALVEKGKKEAGAAPDEKVKLISEQLTQTKTALAEVTGKLTASEKAQADSKLAVRYIAAFPKNRADNLSNDDYLQLISGKVSVELVDGKEVVTINGKQALDPKTKDPLPLNAAMETHFAEKKWLVDPKDDKKGGRGGGNSNPGGGGGNVKKLSDVRKELEEKGINPQGSDGIAYIQQVMNENPEMDLQN